MRNDSCMSKYRLSVWSKEEIKLERLVSVQLNVTVSIRLLLKCCHQMLTTCKENPPLIFNISFFFFFESTSCLFYGHSSIRKICDPLVPAFRRPAGTQPIRRTVVLNGQLFHLKLQVVCCK
ncbi:hypothetical protein GOODEAATRI_006600 [Goodea atripinnis]|uniref:Uncharacterized protein n=1 Tax=Goodea atripinnis TaxID=208336 RepID=A0ABV0PLD8_9TELE